MPLSDKCAALPGSRARGRDFCGRGGLSKIWRGPYDMVAGGLACAWFPSAAEHLLRFIAPGSRGSGRGPTCRSHSRQEPRALPPGTHTSERCSARTLPSAQSLQRPSQDWRTSRQHNACPCPFWGLRRSNPHVICGRPFTAFVPRVEYTLRLDQEELNLVLGVGLMFNTPRNHEHFSSRHMNGAITQVDA